MRDEFLAYQKLMQHRTVTIPDILIVAQDANDLGLQKTEAQIRQFVDAEVFPRIVVAAPDPCIEAWCFADARALRAVLNSDPRGPVGSSGEDWKQRLSESLAHAGIEVLTGPMEIGRDIAVLMDLYEAGKRSPSLGKFIGDMRAQIQSV